MAPLATRKKTLTRDAVQLNDRFVLTAFGAVIGLSAVAHVSVLLSQYWLGLGSLYGLVRQFNMGLEGNLPTFISALQMLVVCLLLAVIGSSKLQRRDPFSRHWLFLSLIFFLLAADEVAEIHEMSIRPIRELAPGLVTGLFYWAWVIPATLLVIAVGFAYAKFVFLYLPPATKRSALLGAFLFVCGSIGVEMPEARFVEQHGMDNLTYGIFVLIEETLEMAGVWVFLAGLLGYFRREVGSITVGVLSAGRGANVVACAALLGATPLEADSYLHAEPTGRSGRAAQSFADSSGVNRPPVDAVPPGVGVPGASSNSVAPDGPGPVTGDGSPAQTKRESWRDSYGRIFHH